MTDNELFLLILMLVMGLPWLIWRLLGDADHAPLVVVQIFIIYTFKIHTLLKI